MEKKTKKKTKKQKKQKKRTCQFENSKLEFSNFKFSHVWSKSPRPGGGGEERERFNSSRNTICFTTNFVNWKNSHFCACLKCQKKKRYTRFKHDVHNHEEKRKKKKGQPAEGIKKMISLWGPPKVVGRREAGKKGAGGERGQHFALLALSRQILPFDALFEVFLWESWSRMKAKPLKLCVWASLGSFLSKPRRPAGACSTWANPGFFE